MSQRIDRIRERVELLIREFGRALRGLSRRPLYAAVTVLTLAVAIAVQNTVAAVADAVLFRSLPYEEQADLVAIRFALPGAAASRFSEGVFLLVEDETTTLEGLAISRPGSATVRFTDSSVRMPVISVSPSLFEVLRLRPLHGRLFEERDSAPGAAPVTVLSHGFWTERFQADPTVIGRSMSVDGVPSTIVGVLPTGLSQPFGEARLVLPKSLDPINPNNRLFAFDGVGRVRDGVTREAIEEDLARITRLLPERFPNSLSIEAAELIRPVVRSYIEEMVGPIRPSLMMVLLVSSLVLIVATANVAGILVARTAGRRTEFAVRMSLGASRSDLRRTRLAEPILLATLGGALGLGATTVALGFVRRAATEALPRASEIGVDGRAMVIGLATVILVASLLGSLNLGKRDEGSVVRERSGGGPDASRLRRLLAGGQVAVACLLGSAAVVIGQGTLTAASADPGFRPEGLVGARIGLTTDGYPEWEDVTLLQQELLRRLRESPAIDEAGLTTYLPLRDGRRITSWNAEDSPPDPDEFADAYLTKAVSDGYLEAMGIRVVTGRTLTRDDWATGAPLVAVVSRELADLVWPGVDPIGRRIQRATSAPPYEVVGVVEGVRDRSLASPGQPLVYTPMDLEAMTSGLNSREFSIAVRTRSVSDAQNAIQEAVRSLDPGVPVFGVEPMDETVSQALAPVRLLASLLAAATTTAMILAALGLYGMVAYTVDQRRREIGIRLALGASLPSILWTVTARFLPATLMGVTVGLTAATTLTPLLSSITPDAQIGLGVLGGVGLGALLWTSASGLVPALRAARTRPVDTLGHR